MKRVRVECPLDPVQPAPSPSRAEVYRAARQYLSAGLSIIPIRARGDKRPAFHLLPQVWSEAKNRPVATWKRFKEEPPSVDEVRDWFGDLREDLGVAVLCGAVSGGLEVLDLDNWAAVGPWAAAVRRAAPGLLDRLVVVQTPRPGAHVYFRSRTCGPSRKLAQRPDPETGGKKPKTLIEVKGEGGYVLAPPSPAACHPSGRCYTRLSPHGPADVPTITGAERDVLLVAALALNRWTPPPRPPRRPRPGVGAGGPRPGDDFNAKADWAGILTPHGWTWVGTGAGGEDRWCRPGKAGAVSATTDHDGHDLLYVFSSNGDPFEEGTGYTKFAAYALLNHDGDFADAARALARRGYGTGNRHARSVRDPFERYGGYATRSRSP